MAQNQVTLTMRFDLDQGTEKLDRFIGAMVTNGFADEIKELAGLLLEEAERRGISSNADMQALKKVLADA